MKSSSTKTAGSMVYTIHLKAVSVNKMFKGRHVHTDEYAAFLEHATYKFKEQRPKEPIKAKRVHIDFYIKNGKGDLDNMLKATIDSLAYARIITEDKEITYLSAKKHKADFDKIEVRVYNDE